MNMLKIKKLMLPVFLIWMTACITPSQRQPAFFARTMQAPMQIPLHDNPRVGDFAVAEVKNSIGSSTIEKRVIEITEYWLDHSGNMQRAFFIQNGSRQEIQGRFEKPAFTPGRFRSKQPALQNQNTRPGSRPAP